MRSGWRRGQGIGGGRFNEAPSLSQSRGVASYDVNSSMIIPSLRRPAPPSLPPRPISPIAVALMIFKFFVPMFSPYASHPILLDGRTVLSRREFASGCELRLEVSISVIDALHGSEFGLLWIWIPCNTV
jgi:hypothetical protein